MCNVIDDYREDELSTAWIFNQIEEKLTAVAVPDVVLGINQEAVVKPIKQYPNHDTERLIDTQ